MKALARFRVALGFALAPIVFWLAQPTHASIAAGAVVAAAGEAVRFWAAGHLHKSREITASGPYRWFAHPLYLGSSVIGVGLAIASARLAAVVLIGSYLAVALTVAANSDVSAGMIARAGRRASPSQLIARSR